MCRTIHNGIRKGWQRVCTRCHSITIEALHPSNDCKHSRRLLSKCTHFFVSLELSYLYKRVFSESTSKLIQFFFDVVERENKDTTGGNKAEASHTTEEESKLSKELLVKAATVPVTPIHRPPTELTVNAWPSLNAPHSVPASPVHTSPSATPPTSSLPAPIGSSKEHRLICYSQLFQDCHQRHKRVRKRKNRKLKKRRFLHFSRLFFRRTTSRAPQSS